MGRPQDAAGVSPNPGHIPVHITGSISLPWVGVSRIRTPLATRRLGAIAGRREISPERWYDCTVLASTSGRNRREEGSIISLDRDVAGCYWLHRATDSYTHRYSVSYVHTTVAHATAHANTDSYANADTNTTFPGCVGHLQQCQLCP